MQENKGFFIACCLISLAWVYAAYDAEYIDSLFAMLLAIGSLISWFGLLLLALYRIIKRSQLAWAKRLAPLWLAFIPLAASASYGLVNRLLTAPSWLVAESYDFTGSDTLLFAKDGEYRYWRGSPLGRSAVIRGRYERRDSLLIMQPNPNVEMPAIARIAIRPYSPFLRRENPVVRLIALDSAGTTVGIFRIKERTD